MAVGRVQVYSRICPSSLGESSVSVSGNTLTVSRGGTHAGVAYTFDGVFDAKATQRDVFYAAAAPLVDDVLNGYNASILAYGQTGTGKTYTMCGPQSWEQQEEEEEGGGPGGGCAAGGSSIESLAAKWSPSDAHAGLLPRCIARVFEALPPGGGGSESSWEVHAAYVQVYREEVYDLLEAPPSGGAEGGGTWFPLSLREDTGGVGVYVEGLTWARVSSPTEALAVAITGTRARATAATLLNAHSSRSHAIFFLRVLRREAAAGGGGGGGGSGSGGVKVGTLALVDLAGSERVARSGAVGARLLEAASINLSLSALGNCVAALAIKGGGGGGGKSAAAASIARAVHVPYRDSKLTRLLQNSLGGNAKTAMVVTLSTDPVCAGESTFTCEFGARASRVRMHATPNVAKDYKAMYLMLKRQMGGIEGGGGGGGEGEAPSLLATPQSGEEELQVALGAAQAKITELEGLVGMLRGEAAAAAAAAAQVSSAAPLPSPTTPQLVGASEGEGIPPSLLPHLLPTPAALEAARQAWAREAAVIRLGVTKAVSRGVEEAVAGRERERVRADAALCALATARGEILAGSAQAREWRRRVEECEEGARGRVEAVLGEVREAREGLEREVAAREGLERECESLRGRLREAVKGGGAGSAASTPAGSSSTIIELYEGSLKAITARVEALEAAAIEKDVAVAEAVAMLRVGVGRGVGGGGGHVRGDGVERGILPQQPPLPSLPPNAPPLNSTARPFSQGGVGLVGGATIFNPRLPTSGGGAATPTPPLSLAGSSASFAANNAARFGLKTVQIGVTPRVRSASSGRGMG